MGPIMPSEAIGRTGCPNPGTSRFELWVSARGFIPPFGITGLAREDAGGLGGGGIGGGERGDGVVGVEAAGVRDDPEAGALKMLRLFAGARPGLGERGAVGADTEDGDDSGSPGPDEVGKADPALAELGPGELVRAGGGAGDQVGDADATFPKVPAVVVGHAARRVDVTGQDAGPADGGVEPVAGPGEVGLHGG